MKTFDSYLVSLAFSPVHCRILCPFILCSLLGVLLACASSAMPASPEAAQTTLPVKRTLTVAAAADLTYAFQEMGARFDQDTGVSVVLNFGSTGLLAQQIEQGAPFDLFAAANISFVDELIQRDRLIPETKALYAQGRLTLWRRADAPFQITDIAQLTQSAIKRIAIADPAHAPYGVAARQAMQTAGIWDILQPKLVFGDNALAALQYAVRGDVDVAIAPLSLAVQYKDGVWRLVPAEMHEPINQALAVVKGTPYEAEARAFAAYINGPQGRPIMRKYGFILPGESPLE